MRSVCLRNLYVQYTKWHCTSTSRKFPVHSQIQTVLFRVICRWKPFLQLIVKCRDRFAKTRGRTVRPWTRLEVHTLVSLQRKPFFFKHDSILIQALRFHVVGDVERLITKACAMPPVTCPYLFIQFPWKYSPWNRILPLIHEIYTLRNISALWYTYQKRRWYSLCNKPP